MLLGEMRRTARLDREVSCLGVSDGSDIVGNKAAGKKRVTAFAAGTLTS